MPFFIDSLTTLAAGSTPSALKLLESNDLINAPSLHPISTTKVWFGFLNILVKLFEIFSKWSTKVFIDEEK